MRAGRERPAHQVRAHHHLHAARLASHTLPTHAPALLARLAALAFPLASDELAADPAAPGPPHPVSLQAYRAALEPHGLVLEDGPRASPLSVRAQEQVVWWSKARQ